MVLSKCHGHCHSLFWPGLCICQVMSPHHSESESLIRYLVVFHHCPHCPHHNPVVIIVTIVIIKIICLYWHHFPHWPHWPHCHRPSGTFPPWQNTTMVVLCIVTLFAFVWPFPTVHFQMLSQMACTRGCIITLVTFVCLFITMCFQMCPQMACMRGCIITLVAFVLLFSNMCF